MTPRACSMLAGALAAAVLLAWFLLRPAAPAAPSLPPETPAQAPVAQAFPRPSDAASGAVRQEIPPPAPEAPAPVEEGRPTLRIHGRVVDPGSRGVPGAGIELRAWSGKDPDTKWTVRRGTTKEDGGFEFAIGRDLASAGFGLETAAPGLLEGWKAVKPGEYDEAAGIEVPVERARAVAGRAVDEYGRGIAGTVVHLWYGSETTWPTNADASGAFRTPATGPRRAFELIVEAPGYPRRAIPLAAADEDLTDVGTVAFRRGGRVAGVVVDARDRPVPDIPVELTGIVEGPGGAPRTRTDGSGHFEFTDVGEGVVGVAADERAGEGGPEGSRRRFRGGIADVQVGRIDVRVVVRTETSIVLRFVDAATGEPVDVKRAEYGLRAEGTPAPERLGHGVGASDGVFTTVLGAWPGRYDVTVRSPGFEDAHVNGVEVGDVAEMKVDVPMRRTP